MQTHTSQAFFAFPSPHPTLYYGTSYSFHIEYAPSLMGRPSLAAKGRTQMHLFGGPLGPKVSPST